MKTKDFIKEGDRLFIGRTYGYDRLSNEEYNDIVERWEELKQFLVWCILPCKQDGEKDE